MGIVALFKEQNLSVLDYGDALLFTPTMCMRVTSVMSSELTLSNWLSDICHAGLMVDNTTATSISFQCQHQTDLAY